MNESGNETLPHPVGTGGGVERMSGPCACPRVNAIRRHHRTRMNRVARRTSTRPPPILSSTPCPYRIPGPLAALPFPDSVGKIHQDTKQVRLPHSVGEHHQVIPWYFHYFQHRAFQICYNRHEVLSKEVPEWVPLSFAQLVWLHRSEYISCPERDQHTHSSRKKHASKLEVMFLSPMLLSSQPHANASFLHL